MHYRSGMRFSYFGDFFIVRASYSSFIIKGDLFLNKMVYEMGKGLDLGAEPPCIKIIFVDYPLGYLPAPP